MLTSRRSGQAFLTADLLPLPRMPRSRNWHGSRCRKAKRARKALSGGTACGTIVSRRCPRMADCPKLLKKARRSASNLRFEEACQLAECYGFEFARGSGSHRVYKVPGVMDIVNLQKLKDGKAEDYQVKQLLGLIDQIDQEDKGT